LLVNSKTQELLVRREAPHQQFLSEKGVCIEEI